MLTRITRALGNLVDNTLDKFATWTCQNYPVPVEQPNSTDGDNFRAQVIRDHDGSPYITRVLFPRYTITPNKLYLGRKRVEAVGDAT
jgi:hypothetical protein